MSCFISNKVAHKWDGWFLQKGKLDGLCMAHHGTFPYSNIPWKHQRHLQIPAQEVSSKVGTALSGALDRCGSSAPVAMGPRWSDRFMHSNLKFNFARPRKAHESLTFRNLQMPRWHPRHVSYCSLPFVVKDVGMHISSLQDLLKCPQFGLVYAELLRTEIDMSHEPILNSLSLLSLTPTWWSKDLGWVNQYSEQFKTRPTPTLSKL